MKSLRPEDPFDRKVTLADYIKSNQKIILGFFAAVVAIALGVPWVKDSVDSSVFVMLGKASPAAMGLIGGILGVSILHAIRKSIQAYMGGSATKVRSKEIVSRYIEKIKDKQSDILRAFDEKITEHENDIKSSLQSQIKGLNQDDAEWYGDEICKQLKLNPDSYCDGKDADISIKAQNGEIVKFRINTTGIKECINGQQQKRVFDHPIKIESYIADLIARDALIEGIGDVRGKLKYSKGDSPKTIISNAIVESGLNGKVLGNKELVVKKLSSTLDSEIRSR